MADPILWVGKAQRTRRIVVDGEQRTERIPQRGHAGNSDYDEPKLAPGKRWELYVKGDGNACRVPLTNAAAHLDDTTPYGQMVRAKARFLGWYPLGSCPCALVLTGELRANHFASKEVARSEPCRPRTYSVEDPCPHALAEQEARQAAHSLVDAKRCKNVQADVERLLSAQKEQTKEIVSGLRDAVLDIATAMRPPPPPPPPADPVPPKDKAK